MRLLLKTVMRNYILQYKRIKAGIILLYCLNGACYIVDILVLQKESISTPVYAKKLKKVVSLVSKASSKTANNNFVLTISAFLCIASIFTLPCTQTAGKLKMLKLDQL